MALRTVGVRLQAEVSGYVAGMRAGGRATRDFVGELDKAARAGKLDAVADQATGVGLALVGVAGYAVTMAAQFDKAMSSVQAATHASGVELEQLRQAAIEAGKDTAYSATEAAQAIEELAKAGVSTADILGGGLSGALSLAAAGQIEVADAAEIAASALTQFQLKGSDVGHVADLLAAGAGKAQGSVHDLSMALNQGGLVSAQMGLSIEDTTGTLAAFASAGLMGSDAGTSLKTALLMLANPTDKSKGLMEDLGIAAYDASGNFVGITSLAGQLKTQLGQLSQEQRNAALAQIFGADAIRSASILYEQGADGIQSWIDKVNDSGYAAETARLKTDNLIGDVERLRGELETLAIQSGSGANGGLRLLVQALEALVSQFGALPPIAGQAITVLAGLTGATLLLGAGWVRARRANTEMLTELRATGPAGTRAARGLEMASRWAGRAAAAFLAFEVAGALVGSMQKDLNPQIEALGKGLADWGRSGQLAGESARVLGSDMKDLATGLKFLADTDNSRRQWAVRLQDSLEFLIPGLDGTNTSLTRTRERVEAMDQALAGLVQSGSADEAAAAFRRLADEAAKDGVSVEELRALLPAYAAAVETAGEASASAAGGVAEVGAEAGRSADEVKKLTEAFDALFEQYMTADKASLKLQESTAALAKELTTGARTLDIAQKAGRDNVEAVLNQIEAIRGLREARLSEGQTLDEVNGKYVKDIAGLRSTLIQLGYNKTAVDELVGKYKELPEVASTQVSAPGAASAKGRVDALTKSITGVPISKETHARLYGFNEGVRQVSAYVRWLDSIPSSVKTRLLVEQNTKRGGNREFNRWGGIHYAADGLLSQAGLWGPGSTLYGFREPETGGEAFIPRNGDLSRSRSIAETVVTDWLGGQVVWQQPRYVAGAALAPAAAAAPAGAPAFDVRVYVGDRELTDIVRVEVAERDRHTARRVGSGARR